MLPLQRIEHPYLHELFKAVLLYDAPEVKKILAREIGGKLMREWKLDRAYQEIAPSPEHERYSGNIDVLWILRHPKHFGYRMIMHEVKTGKYNINEIVVKYEKCHYSPATHNAGSARPTTTNTPLYVWGWKKYHNSDLEKEETLLTIMDGFDTKKKIKRGAVRLLPLDWLLSILEERMSEFLK